jgi:hypothetical protein
MTPENCNLSLAVTGGAYFAGLNPLGYLEPENK